MLCSKCGDRVKPIVACDIDGTLGQYHRHFLGFAQGYLNAWRWDEAGLKAGTPFAERWMAGAPSYRGDVAFRTWFCSVFQVDETTFRQVKLAYRQGGLKRTMPLYGNAATVVREWREAGAEVWLTTTRPYLRLDGIDPDTREWLRRSGIEYDGLLYDDDKYRVLAERVDPARVVAVVDDLGEQCVAAHNVFGMGIPIQRLNGFNERDRYDWSQQLETLPQISEVVLRRIRNWKREVNPNAH